MNKSREILELYAGVLPAVVDTQGAQGLIDLYNNFHRRSGEKIVEGMTEAEQMFVAHAKEKAYRRALRQAERNKWPPAKQRTFATHAAKVAEREAAEYVARISARADAEGNASREYRHSNWEGMHESSVNRGRYDNALANKQLRFYRLEDKTHPEYPKYLARAKKAARLELRDAGLSKRDTLKDRAQCADAGYRLRVHHNWANGDRTLHMARNNCSGLRYGVGKSYPKKNEGMTSYANVNKNRYADRDAQAMPGDVAYAQRLRRKGQRDALDYARQSIKDNLRNARDFDSDTNRNGWWGHRKNEDAVEDFWKHYDKVGQNYDKRYNASHAEMTNHALTKVLDKVGASGSLPPNVRLRAQEGLNRSQQILEMYREAGYGLDEGCTEYKPWADASAPAGYVKRFAGMGKLSPAQKRWLRGEMRQNAMTVRDDDVMRRTVRVGEGYVDERGGGSRDRQNKRRIAFLQHDLNRVYYDLIGDNEKGVHQSVKGYKPKTAKKILRGMRQDLANNAAGGDIRKVPTQDAWRLGQTNEKLNCSQELLEMYRRAGYGADEWLAPALAAGAVALGGAAGCSNSAPDRQTASQQDSTQTDTIPTKKLSFEEPSLWDKTKKALGLDMNKGRIKNSTVPSNHSR